MPRLRPLTLFLSLFLVIGTTGFLVWKCQFGVDLTDEAFYALPAWKLLPLGDQLFRDEIFNAPRQNDWLNQHSIAQLVPYSLLAIRRSAVIFYALALILFLTLCFRRRLSLLGALAFAGALLFDINFMPTWSYNWWIRNMLLLHHATLYLALQYFSGRARPVALMVAGGLLGIGWLAYNSLVPFHLLVLVPFLVFFFRSARRETWFYLAGLALPIALFTLDFFWHQRFTDFRVAMSAMASLGDYNQSFGLTKLSANTAFLWRYPFFWFFGAFVLSLRFWPRLHRLVCAVFLCYLARKLFYTHQQYFLLSAFVSVGIWGAWYALSERTARENYYLVGLSLITVVIVGLSSVARMWAMAWATPVLWGAFLLKFESQPRPLLSRVVVGLSLLFIAKDSFWLHTDFTSTFYDVPIREATTRMDRSPLTGLYTSARRAELVNQLGRAVEGKRFVLAFGDLPGAYLFGGARSAIDTTFADVEASAALIEKSLIQMASRDRFPELIVIAKEHAWTWGMPLPPHPPYTHTPYPQAIAQNRFRTFADCARGVRLYSQAELEIWTVDPIRGRRCLPDSSPGGDPLTAGNSAKPSVKMSPEVLASHVQ